MDSDLRHELPFLLRARTVAFLRRTCFGRCNRYSECMPLLTSVRDGARTLDLPPQKEEEEEEEEEEEVEEEEEEEEEEIRNGGGGRGKTK
ncbi:hypothetical protein SK128_005054 [Halocaridina rubra]|uniref:Uncharacterized protein n=1 Tax=Halocaridina rubra TaxID=373956 RepID=A0AAN8WXD7_HALRR